MTPKEHIFVSEYLLSLNGADAYRKAGYSSKGANVEARKALTKPHIAAEIARRLEERHKRLEIDADALLRRAETILTADPRELTSHHICACRYCYGLGHDYQWKTEREWNAACDAAEALNKPRPGCKGGFGYNITKRPHPGCPECNGLGVTCVRFADTRDLSPAAQVLFEGVKQTKEGLEIIQASKAKALDILVKHKGLMVDKHKRTGEESKYTPRAAKARIVIVPADIDTEITRPDPPSTYDWG